MKPRPVPLLERGRVTSGPLGSDESYGNNGAFIVRGPKSRDLQIIISNGAGWEHASVAYRQTKAFTPTWEEMHWVKTLIWRDDECVMQLHPPQEHYVNCHPGCLHLWKPIAKEVPQPHWSLVGVR
ncbi:MAG: hypothetical protein GWN93_06050 [Deltaproteobacteria bacterium]|nr:hypothetical protein [Deltaproteobacteria bacterium]